MGAEMPALSAAATTVRRRAAGQPRNSDGMLPRAAVLPIVPTRRSAERLRARKPLTMGRKPTSKRWTELRAEALDSAAVAAAGWSQLRAPRGPSRSGCH